MSDSSRPVNSIPRLRPLSPPALELVADILLKSAARDDEYPAYTEEQLVRRKRRIGTGRRLDWQHHSCAAELLAAEMDELAKAAGLSAAQQSAWLMHSEGYSQEEIAEALGVNRYKVMRLVNAACRSIAASPSRYRGLHSAYLSTVRRAGSSSLD